MPPRKASQQITRARRLRRDQTAAEDILWRALRNRGIGAKVRRQVPIGRYVVDFACVAAKLVIEVDGPSHDGEEQQAFDRVREAWLRRNGWRVLRLSNDLVIGGGDIPLKMIKDALAFPSSDPRIKSGGHLLP